MSAAAAADGKSSGVGGCGVRGRGWSAVATAATSNSNSSSSGNVEVIADDEYPAERDRKRARYNHDENGPSSSSASSANRHNTPSFSSSSSSRSTPSCLVVTPISDRSLSKAKAVFAQYSPSSIEMKTDFDLAVYFNSQEKALEAQRQLAFIEFDGTDLCLYYGTRSSEGLRQRDQYNGRRYSCVVHPVSGSDLPALYQLFKPYSGGKPMQAAVLNGYALISFEEEPKALVAQATFSGYSFRKHSLHVEVVKGFEPEDLNPYREPLFVFPVGEEVSKSDVLDFFDPYLSLDCDVRECISINRDTSIATVRGFSTRLHANIAYDKGNGITLKGSEVMVRHRLSDLTLPRESRVFVSNVGDDVLPSDLYTIFKPFAEGGPMQVVIKRSKRYALVGFAKDKQATDAVAVLGNIQVKESFVYLYLSDA